MAMLSELEVLREVTARLVAAGIRCMVTGSVAMNYYAEPRMTRDIDLVVELVPGDGERIRGLFGGDYYVPEENLDEAITFPGMFNIVHLESVVKVDFIHG